MTNDKRLIPEFGAAIWAERKSEREWHHCKYCDRDVPTFILTEGYIGSQVAASKLRCCWECGAGLWPMEIVA